MVYVLGFLDKNRDTFSADLIDLISHSKCEFLYSLFSREKSMVSDCECIVSKGHFTDIILNSLCQCRYYSANNMNKLSWGYATIPEKYKENFDVHAV